MKKNFIMAFVFAAVAGLIFAGSAFAQSGNPPVNSAKKTGDGVTQDYMLDAMANVLGVTVDELQASYDAGQNLYDIALTQGFTVEEIPALMQSARDSALASAVADGVITQAQVDQMQAQAGNGQRGGGQGGSQRGGQQGGGQRGGGQRGGGQGGGAGVCDGTCQL